MINLKKWIFSKNFRSFYYFHSCLLNNKIYLNHNNINLPIYKLESILRFKNQCINIKNNSSISIRQFSQSNEIVPNKARKSISNNKLNIKKENLLKKETLNNSNNLTYGSSISKGRKLSNEDRILTLQINPELSLFAIFDGHGGCEAVNFVVSHIEKFLELLLKDLKNGVTLPQVLQKLFISLDTAFIQEQNLKYEMDGDTDDEVYTASGTTATICLLRNGVDLIVAHVGDSRAILCRSNRPLRLTQDHTADLKSEMDRIIKFGGSLSWSSIGKSRVNGRLEMTRSIGDLELKPFGVLSIPDIVSIKLRPESDSFLLLTTDGVHTKISSNEMIQLVSKSSNSDEASKQLTEQALFYGSHDNCTALVVKLGAWDKLNTSSRKINFSNKHYNSLFRMD